MLAFKEQKDDFIRAAREGGLIRAVRKEYETLSAALSYDWNWRGLRERPVESRIFPLENPLPGVVRDFMRCAGEVANGPIVVYGGSLNDLVNGREPRDYDGYCMTGNHPFLAMRRVEQWAASQGYEVLYPRRRIHLLWKRITVRTDHAEYDISFLHGKKSFEALVQQMADDPDVSPCARSATVKAAFQSERCLVGEREQQLVFRALKLPRDQFRHLDRWLKYAIVKYPHRSVVYTDAANAALFAELNEHRPEIAAQHADLCRQGAPPADFEPFRPVIPRLYDQLLAGMRS